MAASKWRKSHQRVLRLRPYADKLDEMLAHALFAVSDEYDALPYLSAEDEGSKASGRLCLVIMTADRGLCGGFNSNIIKRAEQHLKSKYPQQLAAGEVTLVRLTLVIC